MPASKTLSACLVVLMLAMTISWPVGAKDNRLTLRNKISVDINRVQPRLRGTKEWGSDLLGKQRLRVGKQVDVILKSGAKDCVFDLKVYDDEGDVWFMNRVDICKSATIDMK